MSDNPKPLAANKAKSFNGSFLRHQGFVIEKDEAERLIARNAANADVVKPYLRGEDFNNNPDQSPALWAIDFLDRTLREAEKYPECMEIVRKRVYPERMSLDNESTYKQIWWQFWRPRVELYRAIASLGRILFHPFTSKFLCFDFVPTNMIYTAPHVVIALPDDHAFAILQSNLHECWVRKYGSTLETRLRYTASDVFETFPFPSKSSGLDSAGRIYREHRRDLMLARQEGLTATYNRLHDPNERHPDIVRLRELHREIDYTVAAAYGWKDLALGHGFHETPLGIRFTINEDARLEVLARLLRLNHERYEEEVLQGLHKKEKDSKPKAEGRKRKAEGERKEKATKESGEGYKAKLL